MKTEIYSIIYAENQIPEFIPYDNSHVRSPEQFSFFFENNPIKDILEKKPFCSNFSMNYLGIFSWKFSLKTGIFKKKLYWYLENNPNYDVYIFCRKLPMDYLAFTENHHPGFKLRMELLLEKLNQLPSSIEHNILLEYKEPKHVVYSNFFIAREGIYQEYYNFVLKPCMKILIEDKELSELCNQDANYRGLPKEQLFELTGLHYYSFPTFLLERLFSLYLDFKTKTSGLTVWKL